MQHEDLYKKKEAEHLELVDLKSRSSGNFIHVDCPSCSEPIPVDNIDLASKMGKCSNCDALFSVEQEMNNVQVNITDVIPRPEGVEILHFKDELELSAAQPILVFDILVICLLPFVAIFAFLLYFLKGMEPGIFVGLASAAISTFSIIRAARRKENRIFILMDQKRLTIQWRPKNLIKDKEYDIDSIDQVYVKVAADGMALFIIVDGINGQKHIPILKRMTNLGHAKYLEQEIERYLNIPNRAIPGEI